MNFVKPVTARAAFTLIHISDFHLCYPMKVGLHQFMNKRAFSYLSWMVRRRKQHHPEVLRALTEAVQTSGFDQLVVTGDLTQLALSAEVECARRHLQALGPPDKVFVIPGNHDALVRRGWPESHTPWASYMASDPTHPHRPDEYPRLRVRGPIALIGLSTAHPTRMLSAAGSLGTLQLQRLAAILQETAARRLLRVLLIHHPPISGMLAPHKRLRDVEAFSRIAKRHGAELILHGHSHRFSRAAIDGPNGRIPVLGISSASATSRDPMRRAAFRSIRIAPAAKGWTITSQSHFYSEEAQTFVGEPNVTQESPLTDPSREVST
jgi:3',5'-cyclic AMP phosphodiesterase CpdA